MLALLSLAARRQSRQSITGIPMGQRPVPAQRLTGHGKPVARTGPATRRARSTTSAYTTQATDDLYFVAGPGTSSGENPYTVSVSGNQYAHSLNFQSSGAPTFSGTGTINLGGGGINVPQYGYGTTAQGAVEILPQIVLQAPQTWSNSSSNAFTTAGVIVNGGNQLTIGGPGNTSWRPLISGSGGLAQSRSRPVDPPMRQ